MDLFIRLRDSQSNTPIFFFISGNTKITTKGCSSGTATQDSIKPNILTKQQRKSYSRTAGTFNKSPIFFFYYGTNGLKQQAIISILSIPSQNRSLKLFVSLCSNIAFTLVNPLLYKSLLYRIIYNRFLPYPYNNFLTRSDYQLTVDRATINHNCQKLCDIILIKKSFFFINRIENAKSGNGEKITIFIINIKTN